MPVSASPPPAQALSDSEMATLPAAHSTLGTAGAAVWQVTKEAPEATPGLEGHSLASAHSCPGLQVTQGHPPLLLSHVEALRMGIPVEWAGLGEGMASQVSPLHPQSPVQCGGGLTRCWMAACLCSISRFSTAESITSWSSYEKGRQGGKKPLSLRPWLGLAPPLPQTYLSRQLLHVGVQLVQQAVALLEEAVLGVHEGQHLPAGGTGEATCPTHLLPRPVLQGSAPAHPAPGTHRIQDLKLLLGLEDIDLPGEG